MRAILIFTILFYNVASVVAQEIFTHKTANATITMLSERQGEVGSEALIGVTEQMEEALSYGGTFTQSVCSFIIQPNQGEIRNILIDTGYGTTLNQNLAKMGLAVGDIDVVLITHSHPDHIGGLIMDGVKMFPNATLYISKDELTFVSDKAAEELSQYQVVTFDPQQQLLNEVVGGVQAIACYGHTPGHTLYLIDDLLVWGDMVHSILFQMPYPEVTFSYDSDKDEARASRAKLLKHITDNDYIVAGMHIPYPGMGRLKPNGKGGYVFTPLE